MVFQISVFGSLEAKPNACHNYVLEPIGISNIGIWKLGSKTQRRQYGRLYERRYFKYRYLEAWKQNPTVFVVVIVAVLVFQISVFGSLEAKPNPCEAGSYMLAVFQISVFGSLEAKPN